MYFQDLEFYETDNFQYLLNINDNSFLKIEYINYLLENNLNNKFYIIN